MNPAKTHIKTIMAEEFGRHIEKMGEKAGEKVHSHKGGKDAFVLAAQRVAQLAEHIDKDMEEGVIEEYVGEPLKVAAYVKRYLKRAVGLLDNLATAAEIATHTAQGRAIGLKDANEYVNGVWKEEMTKLDAFKAALAEDESVGLDEGPPPSSSDGHPGPSLKAQRQAESEEPKAESKAKPKAESKEPKSESKAKPKTKKTKAKKTT
jgi:hypothetical protein